jgi:hypothetical protein
MTQEAGEPGFFFDAQCTIMCIMSSQQLDVVCQQAEDLMALQPVSPTEFGEFDQESEPGHDTAGLFHQLHLCRSGAASGQEIVVDEHALAGLNGIGMDLQSISAVLQGVLATADLARQLAGLAGGGEADPQSTPKRPPR